MEEGEAVIFDKDGREVRLEQTDILRSSLGIQEMLRLIEDAIERARLPSVLRGRVTDEGLVD